MAQSDYEKETINSVLFEKSDTDLIKENNVYKEPISLRDADTISSLNEDSVEYFYDTADVVSLLNENQANEREKLSSISLSFQSTIEADFNDLNSKNNFEAESNNPNRLETYTGE